MTLGIRRTWRIISAMSSRFCCSLIGMVEVKLSSFWDKDVEYDISSLPTEKSAIKFRGACGMLSVL